MLVFLGPPYETLGLSQEELQERMGKWWTWSNRMQQDGIVVSGEALHAPAKRVSGTERTVTDGPFAEGKELVGGFYVIKANSMEDAIKESHNYPDFDLDGTVEVREVIEFEQK